MLFVTLVVVLATLFAYADDKRLLHGGFKISFWLLTLCMSLRYDYGNDYFSYMRIFDEINGCQSLISAYKQSGMEIGWVLLTRLLSPFGFQSQILVCSLILYGIFYSLIYKYVSRPYRWLSLLLFLLNDSLFLLDLSMLRQGLSCALFAFAICFALDNKRVKSTIVWLVGVSIHTSAIIGLPFLIIVFLKKVINPMMVLLLSVIICVYMIANPNSSEYLFSFLLENMEGTDIMDLYGKYIRKATDFRLGIGVFIEYISIIPGLLYFKYFKEFDKYMVIFYTVILLLIPLSANSIMLMRIISYFMPFVIILFPRFCDRNRIAFDIAIDGQKSYRWQILSKSAIALYMIYVAYSYVSFFDSETYGFAYKHFHVFF